VTDALVAGGATFVALATAIITAFIAGKIYGAGTVDMLRGFLSAEQSNVKDLTTALQRRNDIDEARQRDERGRG
jgi:hypothetical protein